MQLFRTNCVKSLEKAAEVAMKLAQLSGSIRSLD